MLQRKEDGSPEVPTRVYGFLVGVQIEEGVDISGLALRLSDSLAFIEGVGETTVDILGEVEVVNVPAEEEN